MIWISWRWFSRLTTNSRIYSCRLGRLLRGEELLCLLLACMMCEVESGHFFRCTVLNWNWPFVRAFVSWRQGFDVERLRMQGNRKPHLWPLLAGNCMSVPVIGSVLMAVSWLDRNPFGLQGWILQSSLSELPIVLILMGYPRGNLNCDPRFCSLGISDLADATFCIIDRQRLLACLLPWSNGGSMIYQM